MYFVYFGSRKINEETTRDITAVVSGAIYVCCIFLSPLFLLITLYSNAIPIKKAILVSIAIPVIWIAKDVVVLTESHPLIEAVYWLVNLCTSGLDASFRLKLDWVHS